MLNIIMTFSGVAIGVIATVFASRYYFRRSVDKQLTPFVQNLTNVLHYIEEDVKSELEVRYRGVQVENLQQTQFLIANTGERAIRDLIEPLTLKIDSADEIMDVNILHIHPHGRDVKANLVKSGKAVKFDFPLLNKDEFFIVKLLVNGNPDRWDYKFNIVADDLPPQLLIKSLSYDQIEHDGPREKRGFELGPAIGGLVFLFLSLCISLISYYVGGVEIPVIESEVWSWLNFIPFIGIAHWVGYIVAFIFGLIAIFAIIGAFTSSFEFPKRKKFKVPSELASASWQPDLHDLGMEAAAANNQINEGQVIGPAHY